VRGIVFVIFQEIVGHAHLRSSLQGYDRIGSPSACVVAQHIAVLLPTVTPQTALLRDFSFDIKRATATREACSNDPSAGAGQCQPFQLRQRTHAASRGCYSKAATLNRGARKPLDPD